MRRHQTNPPIHSDLELPNHLVRYGHCQTVPPSTLITYCVSKYRMSDITAVVYKKFASFAIL
jgi:hypothetical protein